MAGETSERASTPIERLREMERLLLERSAVFGTAIGALFRIAQGVDDPQGAAAFALRMIGADDLADCAASKGKERVR